MNALQALVSAGLNQEVPQDIADVGRALSAAPGAVAVLFYGSALRSGARDGVLDFYVLRDAPPSRNPARRWLWPDVSYHEIPVGGAVLRAKVATMPLATFERAAAGKMIDTTIWTRFCQPARLVWAQEAVRGRVQRAVAAAVGTASRLAAALGPAEGAPADYWTALFAQTYGAEFRVEQQGRGNGIVANDPAYFDAVLRAAWAEAGLVPESGSARLRPALTRAQRRRWRAGWRARKALGKPLNIARLVKAAWTFDGAARYALWKIEPHSGLAIPLTRWRERHPILAAPGVLFQMWRLARH